MSRLLVQYDVETPYEQIYSRIYTIDPAAREDIARDVLDAVDGSPTYTVNGEVVIAAAAVAALVNGQLVRRDYHDGDDEVIYDLRISQITPEEEVVLRKFGIA